MLLLSFSSLVYADFYVIPVPISKKIKNVITVAKSGGQFTDVKEAVDSIGDASETNPYLVYIAPGHYTVTATIDMKPFVTIMGSGEKATVLEGRISTDYQNASSAIISGENHASLVNLAVVNNGGNYDFSIGIWYGGISSTITDVTVTVSGAKYNYGVNNLNSSPTMTNVTVKAFGGTSTVGVYNGSSSSSTMTNVTATASGGNFSYGVFNSSSSPTMTNVAAKGSGTTFGYGVYNYETSSPIIRNSILNGDTHGINIGNVSLSTVYNGGNSATCSYCVDENGTELDGNCVPVAP